MQVADVEAGRGFSGDLSSAATSVQRDRQTKHAPQDRHCFAKASCEKLPMECHEMGGYIFLQGNRQAIQCYILWEININRLKFKKCKNRSCNCHEMSTNFLQWRIPVICRSWEKAPSNPKYFVCIGLYDGWDRVGQGS